MKAFTSLIAFAIFALLTQPWIRSPDTPKVATLVVAPEGPGYTGAALVVAPDKNIGITAFVSAITASDTTPPLHKDPGKAYINGNLGGIFLGGGPRHLSMGPQGPEHTV